nr:hypothetical protein [Kibdelosporangium sp. MJ126-NF4]CEL14152.1 hypothetical protein [Kibdelosporangium sp. MJ126-NF4]CTQ88519.1 hypothetical protein [Kibdelosporangium sp. MJ126-NF4]
MWLLKTLFGSAFADYVSDLRAMKRRLGPSHDEPGWLISAEEDTPRPENDLPDEEGAMRLRDLESSRALRGLSGSYRRQPIQTTADEAAP